jgi:superfamily II DNA/RNA helicase
MSDAFDVFLSTLDEEQCQREEATSTEGSTDLESEDERQAGRRNMGGGDEEVKGIAEALGREVSFVGKSFSELHLPLEAIEVLERRNGIKKPTETERRVIPRVLAMSSLAVLAPTGSGKTLSYVLPMAKVLSEGRGRRVKGAVIVPTYELAAQVASFAEEVAGVFGLQTCVVHAGLSLRKTCNRARRADILVSTPGKILDLLSSRRRPLSRCLFLVFDEFDKLFRDKSFAQLLPLFSFFPHSVHLFFSATAAASTLSRIRALLPRMKLIWEKGSKRRNSVISAVGEQREREIERIIRKKRKTMVFVDKKESVRSVQKRISLFCKNVLCIDGEMPIEERQKRMEAFRREKRIVLVCTPLLSRGIDIRDIDCVINHSCPSHYDELVHRNGRIRGKGRMYTFIGGEPAESLCSLRLFLREHGDMSKTNEFTKRFARGPAEGEDK